MKRVITVSFALTLMGASMALGQQTVFAGSGAGLKDSHLDLAIGYNLVRANAPPADCGCFTMNGGYVAGEANFSPWLGVVGEFSGGHATTLARLART